MSVLLNQNQNYLASFGPVFRSSAIFYIPKNTLTTITVSNYWDFKNNLKIGLLFSVRDMNGRLIERSERYFNDSLVINVSDWPVAEGSVEIEAFGNCNLRIPYAAVMGVYETEKSVSMVHSYSRNHSLIELEDKNSLTLGRESCWTIRTQANIRNFAVFHNGHVGVRSQTCVFSLTSVDSREKTIHFEMPDLRPFQTYKFEIIEIFPDYKTWLAGSDGWGTVHFENHTAFTRLLLVWEDVETKEIQVTHSNFDYSEIQTNLIEANKPAIMKWPSIVSKSSLSRVIVYPKFSKGRYIISSPMGVIETDTGLFINVSKISALDFRVANTESIPSRIVTGFFVNLGPNVLPLECSLGIVHEKRPAKRFHWAVVSRRFQSQLHLNAYPEFYEVPDNLFIVFRLYSPSTTAVAERRIELKRIDDAGDCINVFDLFESSGDLLGGDFCYVSMFSNFGGWFMYSSMKKGDSMTIEHSF